MSCCNGPIIVYPRCPPDCPDVPEYLFQNANLIGQGVFKDNVDGTVSFFGVTNTDGTIEISLDTNNNAISIDLNADLLAGNFPDATTTAKGKVELAIDAEAQAKNSTTVVLTPSNLAALGATTSLAGLIEIATDAEAQAGTATDLAITPATLGLVTGTALRMGLVNGTSNDTKFDFSGAKFELVAGAGSYVFQNSGFAIAGAPLSLGTGSALNFNGGKVQLAGVDVAANSFITTTGTSGVPGSLSFGSVFILGSEDNELQSDTLFDVSTFQLSFLEGGSSLLTISPSGLLLEGHTFNLGTGSKLSFDTGSKIQVSGVDVPADSLIRTDSAAGVVTSELLALYFGPHTVTEDYFIDPFIANRSFDPATVTLPNLAIVVASLIQDLAAVHKPVIA